MASDQPADNQLDDRKAIALLIGHSPWARRFGARSSAGQSPGISRSFKPGQSPEEGTLAFRFRVEVFATPLGRPVRHPIAGSPEIPLAEAMVEDCPLDHERHARSADFGSSIDTDAGEQSACWWATDPVVANRLENGRLHSLVRRAGRRGVGEGVILPGGAIPGLCRARQGAELTKSLGHIPQFECRRPSPRRSGTGEGASRRPGARQTSGGLPVAGRNKTLCVGLFREGNSG